MVVLLECYPISTEELWSYIRVTIGFHLRMMEATVFLGTFNGSEMFWYLHPDLCFDTILSRSSTDNSFELMAWFLL